MRACHPFRCNVVDLARVCVSSLTLLEWVSTVPDCVFSFEDARKSLNLEIVWLQATKWRLEKMSRLL